MATRDGSKINASWDKHVVHAFCDLCVREIEAGNRPGMHLTRKGWHNVISKFAKETGREYRLQQLKSKWDVLKKDWKQWKLLIENETEIKWNPSKDTIDASNAWWEEKIKVFPEAKRFRRHGIEPELEQKLDKMFTVVFDLDEYATVPSDADEVVYSDEPEPKPKPERSRKRKSHDNSFWQDKSEKMELVVDPIPREPIITNNPVDKTLSPKNSPKVEVVLDPDQRLINRQDRLPDEFESRSKAPSIKCDHTCSITDAVRLLDSISEVPKASPLYYFAIKLILNKDKREVFMALTPETKVWWLKMEEQESRN